LSDEAELYLQLLVGLVDKERTRYSRDLLVNLAGRYGFAGTVAESPDDPTLALAPMVSRELLGIWEDMIEPSVLLLQIIPTDPARYRFETERWRSLVAAILTELNQDAVYWFPAIRYPIEHAFHNLLLRPAVITKPQDVVFPDPREVFGRQVHKTLSLIRGPARSGAPSLIVYEADWVGAPLFIPNCHWIPPYGERGQEALIEDDVRQRYPFVGDLTLNVVRNPEWRSSATKPTGDRLKARTFGEYANYTFQFAVVEPPDLISSDPAAEFRDLKGRKCMFRTVAELVADPATRAQNADVLRAMEHHFPALFRPERDAPR
jgi:hypothetical protein